MNRFYTVVLILLSIVPCFGLAQGKVENLCVSTSDGSLGSNSYLQWSIGDISSSPMVGFLPVAHYTLQSLVGTETIMGQKKPKAYLSSQGIELLFHPNCFRLKLFCTPKVVYKWLPVSGKVKHMARFHFRYNRLLFMY